MIDPACAQKNETRLRRSGGSIRGGLIVPPRLCSMSCRLLVCPVDPGKDTGIGPLHR